MKKVVDFVQYVSFDGGETFQDTSIWSHLCYVEPTEEKVVVLETFEQAYDYIKADKLMNAEIDTTFFRGRKQIHISTAELDCRRSFTEKNYKPVIVKTVLEEKTNVSIENLSHFLSADEFCEWLKDRNITNFFIKQLTNNQKNGIIIIEREVMKNVSDKSNKHKDIGNTTFP